MCWFEVRHFVEEIKCNLILYAGLLWLQLCAQATETETETGIFETGSAVAVVIQMNITEGPAMTDLHMSGPDLTALDMSVTAHPTVCGTHNLLIHTFIFFIRP